MQLSQRRFILALNYSSESSQSRMGTVKNCKILSRILLTILFNFNVMLLPWLIAPIRSEYQLNSTTFLVSMSEILSTKMADILDSGKGDIK